MKRRIVFIGFNVHTAAERLRVLFDSPSQTIGNVLLATSEVVITS